MFEAKEKPKLYDPITNEFKTIATFASPFYNGEFESLFKDLTIKQDVKS